jgi:hypothetical protein
MVYPQERDELQIQSFSALEGRNGFSSFGLEYGLTDSLQFEVEGGFDLGNGQAEGSQFGLQWSALDLGSTGIHVAVGLENESEGGSTFAQQRSYAVVAKEYDWPIGRSYVFGNVGFGLRQAVEAEETEDNEGQGRWDVSTGFALEWSRSFRMTQELSWAEHELTAAAERRLHWVPGVVWLLPTGSELGLGFFLPLRGGAPFWALSLVHELDGFIGR